MVQQSLKFECTLASQDVKHRCIANTVSAKMVWTSRMHAGKQATKAALLQWTERGPSIKKTAKALLQRHPEKIAPEVWHWWRTMGNYGNKQVWMEASYSQRNRSLWKWKATQASGKRCSSKSQNQLYRALHWVPSMWPPVCIRLWPEIPHEGTQIKKVLGWT